MMSSWGRCEILPIIAFSRFCMYLSKSSYQVRWFGNQLCSPGGSFCQWLIWFTRFYHLNLNSDLPFSGWCSSHLEAGTWPPPSWPIHGCVMSWSRCVVECSPNSMSGSLHGWCCFCAYFSWSSINTLSATYMPSLWYKCWLLDLARSSGSSSSTCLQWHHLWQLAWKQ